MGTFQIDFGAAKKPKIIGIDLGTTNSLGAFLDLTGPRILPGADGRNLVPSVVYYGEGGETEVGYAAVEKLRSQPERTVYSAKRLMGRGFADVRHELAHLTFGVDESESRGRI